jgi:chromate reductase, NAD(P)H dehydrogenase (quinone)
MTIQRPLCTIRVAHRNAPVLGNVARIMVAMARVVLISGSLRRGSINSAALRTAVHLMLDSAVSTLYQGMADLPAFNPDLDEDPLPPTVVDLRQAIRGADALLFSVPEYAGGLPGSFKNLLDWTVGDDRPGSIYQKPVGWVNVAPRGAPHAHDSLRRVLGYVGAQIVEPACVEIPVTSAMVSEDGLIADHSARLRLSETLETLAEACSP